jgi:hypothetical protein
MSEEPPIAPSADRNESRRLRSLRLVQMRRDARVRAAREQIDAAKAVTRMERTIFSSVVLAAIAGTITLFLVGYTIASRLSFDFVFMPTQ